MTNDRKRVAVITGASSGFGKLFTHELEKNLDLEEIWLVARREDKLIELASSLERVEGIPIAADLSTKEGLDIISERAEKENPFIKVLINNAGFGRSEEFCEGEEKYYGDMIDVNVKAPVILTRKLLQYMAESSMIANVASSAAFAPLPYFNVYSATKCFILNFSYALGEELKEKDISVTVICSGPAQTEFFKTKEKKVNHLKIEDPVRIVEKAVRDMKKRKRISVYGTQTNLLRFVSFLLPKSLLAKIAGHIKYPK